MKTDDEALLGVGLGSRGFVEWLEFARGRWIGGVVRVGLGSQGYFRYWVLETEARTCHVSNLLENGWNFLKFNGEVTNKKFRNDYY